EWIDGYLSTTTCLRRSAKKFSTRVGCMQLTSLKCRTRETLLSEMLEEDLYSSSEIRVAKSTCSLTYVRTEAIWLYAKKRVMLETSPVSITPGASIYRAI